MAAAHALYFGVDTCFRARVLRGAGYEVDECRTVPEMVEWFKAGQNADVVCISEEPDAEKAVAIVHALSAAPIVQFCEVVPFSPPQNVGLVVPAFTQPRVWLDELADLIALTRANCAASQRIQEQSRQLRAESEQTRVQSAKLRMEIKRQREQRQN
ncbi:hypothetical protein DYQ86_04635 [Acidobacteria bacterium AB60]|nr:hypothetical protein DYQ86_04635 [Acidobacteria bacterium AB60]